MALLDGIKGIFKRLRKAFEPMFKAVGHDKPTANEMRLDADEWTVKRKLGPSFFTRHLSPNTRALRIASLTHKEYLLAMKRRWIGGK